MIAVPVSDDWVNMPFGTNFGVRNLRRDVHRAAAARIVIFRSTIAVMTSVEREANEYALTAALTN